MSEEVGEVIRVLQLTTYDEDEWDSDNLVSTTIIFFSFVKQPLQSGGTTLLWNKTLLAKTNHVTFSIQSESFISE